MLFGEVGLATIGHSDSEQGTAPIIGGGLAFQARPWLVAEVDLHAARVDHVFGRESHDFTETTATASLLFRASPERRVHFVVGGGMGWQRARSEFTIEPTGHVDRVETIRLLHGRAGVEWDLTDRVVLRTDGALWVGDGLDWVVGGRIGMGYRF